jgi:hypothetical protein
VIIATLHHPNNHAAVRAVRLARPDEVDVLPIAIYSASFQTFRERAHLIFQRYLVGGLTGGLK